MTVTGTQVSLGNPFHIHTPTYSYVLCYSQFSFNMFNEFCHTHIVVCQSVDSFPPALFLGSQVQI